MPETVKPLKDISLAPIAFGGSVGTATGGLVGTATSYFCIAKKYPLEHKDRLQLICGFFGGIVGAIAGGTMGFMVMRSVIMRNGTAAARAVGKMHSGALIGAIGGATAGGFPGATAGYTVAGVIYDSKKIKNNDDKLPSSV